jgi:transposase-like protein
MRIVNQLERTLMAPDPVRALRELRVLRAELDALERERVRAALDSGASFAAVARGLGITRQAAHRRYRHLTAEPPRLVATPDALALLQRARHEAARLGSATVEPEHVALAHASPGPRPHGGTPPAALGRVFFDALARVGAPIGVGELLRVAAQDPRANEVLQRRARPGVERVVLEAEPL